jgi:replicative DNA helicase
MHPHDMPADLLPWSPEAEAGVLSALLRDNAVWDKVGDLLEGKHFYDHANALVFAAIGELVNASRPADMLTVFDALQKSGKADAAGGLEYLADLNAGVTGAANARRYAEIVRERALMRGILEAAESVKELATRAGLSAAERIDQAQAVLQALQVGGAGRGMPTLIDDNVVSLLDRIQSAADGTAPTGIPTGIPGLDRMFGGGFKGGKQIILAARPSVGKSSLAQQFCINLASAGYPSAFLSQEMSKDELTDRAVSNLGRIQLENVITGRLADNEWQRLTEAVEILRQFPLFFDDQPALTLHDISAKARMLVRQHGVRLIVIDYLQLCSGADDDSRHHQIEALSRGIKKLARQLDVCFITLSQLNREVEKRSTGRPVLSDLKESGAIEEDADIVMLLSRGATTPDGFQIINCDIPKNRQGRVGAITLGFNGAHQQWHETVAPVEFKQPPRRHYTEDI